MEVTDEIISTIEKYLKEDRPEELLLIIKCEQKKQQLIAAAWDLVPVLCQFLTHELEYSRRCVVTGAAEILIYLAQISNPKELLLVLLEQADTFKDDIKFRKLLKPVQICLLRLPGTRSHSLAIALETFNAHIEALPLPEERQFEGRERLLLDLDECVFRATTVIPDYVDFIEPFINDAVKDKEANKRLLKEITNALIKMLGHPLAFLDLAYNPEMDKAAKSNSRCCAERVIEMLGKVHLNFVSCFLKICEENERLKVKSSNTEEGYASLQYPLPELGLHIFAFLAFGEQLSKKCIPQIYSPVYILQISLPAINHLLCAKESLLVGKGIPLFRNRVAELPPSSVSLNDISQSDVTEAIESLIKVMTSAQVKELCQLAVKVLSELLAVFERKARYIFIRHIFNTTSNVGMFGHCITLLKNEINEELGCNQPTVFIGAALRKLLDIIFVLPNKEQTDLMDNSDAVMGALNLLRYLIIRDPQNVTGFWDILPQIQSGYLEELRCGINMSRAHYDLEMKQLKNTGRSLVPSDFEINVGGQDMPPMGVEQQKDVIQTALHAFDVMESLVGRVGELIHQNKS